jgi:hypothetical protein
MEMLETYQNLYDNTIYGSGAHNCCPGVRDLPKYRRFIQPPVIDVGCGRGDTVDLLRSLGVDAIGIDQITLNNDMLTGDITATQDWSIYKTALCIDVLEHITFSRIRQLLLNMAATERQIITVHTGASGTAHWTHTKQDVELHITQLTFAEWDEVIGQHLTIQRTAPKGLRKFYICGGPL